jgi:hypothetical protein
MATKTILYLLFKKSQQKKQLIFQKKYEVKSGLQRLRE